MQTIETKYHGPGNVRGSRISATASGGGGRVMLSYDDELNDTDNHKAAALALMAKMDWEGTMQGGDLKRGMVWIFVGEAFVYEIKR